MSGTVNTDSMVPSRQCFAYSQDGQRCELGAGHEDEHRVSVVWSDEESWTPDALGAALANAQAASVLGSIDAALAAQEPPTGDDDSVGPVDPRTLRCVNCEHRVHDDECHVRVGQTECGCTFGVA